MIPLDLDYQPKHRKRYGMLARCRDGENGYVGQHRRMSLGESLASMFTKAFAPIGSGR